MIIHILILIYFIINIYQFSIIRAINMKILFHGIMMVQLLLLKKLMNSAKIYYRNISNTITLLHL